MYGLEASQRKTVKLSNLHMVNVRTSWTVGGPSTRGYRGCNKGQSSLAVFLKSPQAEPERSSMRITSTFFDRGKELAF